MKINLYIYIFISFLMLITTNCYAGIILIVGDSLSVPDGYGFGRELEKILKQDGHKVHTLASCGASPSSFLNVNYKTRCGYYQSFISAPPISHSYEDFKNKKVSPKLTPKLDEIISKDLKLDLVIIQQGTNLYNMILENSISNGALYVTREVTEMLKKIKLLSPSSKCIWMGPPEITKYGSKIIQESSKKLMNEAIKEGINQSQFNCDFIDSRPLTPKPNGDGTHFSSAQQIKKWVFEAYKQSLKLLSAEDEKTILNKKE